jgi:hypothetical protein
MTFKFIYSQSEANRIVPSVLIDNRVNNPAIANQVGSIIKAYTDTEAAKVTDTCVFYKIETIKSNTNDVGTEQGNLAGYFTLEVGGSAVILLQYELRASFQQFSAAISGLINNFISNSEWQKDYLP